MGPHLNKEAVADYCPVSSEHGVYSCTVVSLPNLLPAEARDSEGKADEKHSPSREIEPFLLFTRAIVYPEHRNKTEALAFASFLMAVVTSIYFVRMLSYDKEIERRIAYTQKELTETRLLIG